MEVEWRGRARIVVARLARFPSTSTAGAVVVCALEDEPQAGEWLVVRSLKQLYRLDHPEGLRKICCRVQGASEREFSFGLKRRTLTRLRRVVSNAFAGRGIFVARAFALGELPREPRFAVLLDAHAAWCWRSNLATGTPFDPGFSSLAHGEGRGRELLLGEWNDEGSAARFAWEWAGWNDEKRKALCCGLEGDLGELARVMRWVLICSEPLWNIGSRWVWTIHPEFAARGYVTNFHDSGRPFMLCLSAWQELLFACFAPGWRADWLERHECVRDFWRRTGALESASMDEAPTQHERLEAHLCLREWLQRNAPERLSELLLL